MYLLTEADPALHCSLLRIYFAESASEENEEGGQRKINKKSKYFRNREYSGEEMLMNLYLTYIESINNKNELFESSMNPLYLLIEAKFICFFMPVFRKFSQIVFKCIKLEFDGPAEFYKAC